MSRRVVLKLIGSVASWPLCSSILAAAKQAGQGEVTFFVAGVRFQDPAFNVSVGNRVSIVSRTYRGARCYEVLLGQSRIGYVPHQTIDKLCDLHSLTGTISAANKYALPWKRYEVRVTPSVISAAIS